MDALPPARAHNRNGKSTPCRRNPSGTGTTKPPLSSGEPFLRVALGTASPRILGNGHREEPVDPSVLRGRQEPTYYVVYAALRSVGRTTCHPILSAGEENQRAHERRRTPLRRPASIVQLDRELGRNLHHAATETKNSSSSGNRLANISKSRTLPASSSRPSR